jgi:hypothetical protein
MPSDLCAIGLYHPVLREDNALVLVVASSHSSPTLPKPLRISILTTASDSDIVSPRAVGPHS